MSSRRKSPDARLTALQWLTRHVTADPRAHPFAPEHDARAPDLQRLLQHVRAGGQEHHAAGRVGMRSC